MTLVPFFLGCGLLLRTLPVASQVCDAGETSTRISASVLLQSNRATTHRWGSNGDHLSMNVVKLEAPHKSAHFADVSRIIPSGAAAPLNEAGYAAVANRCCKAEMMEFIRRQVTHLNYEVCEESGQFGITLYHSCENLQSFAKLTSDIIADSAKRCTWVGQSGKCQPLPEDCPAHPGPQIYDCGCKRSDAAKLDFTSPLVAVAHSNLGGVGPDKGAQELRFSSGTSATGVRFDVVVTATNGYEAVSSSKDCWNTKEGGFGCISVKSGTFGTFKFSFMVPGTNTPVTLTEIHMAVFDLDGDSNSGSEYTNSTGYQGYVTDANPSILPYAFPPSYGGGTMFMAPRPGKDIANPLTPTQLTEEQRKNTVMFFFKAVSSFDLTFGSHRSVHLAPANTIMYFAFESALNDRCAP